MENICYRTRTPLCIDGRLEEDAWKKAPWSHRFVDVIGGTPALYDSRAAVLWDDRCLYVGFWAEEPYPTATITQRDGYLWFENDLEVFIAGEDTYYEFQISARNTVYEVYTYIYSTSPGAGVPVRSLTWSKIMPGSSAATTTGRAPTSGTAITPGEPAGRF